MTTSTAKKTAIMASIQTYNLLANRTNKKVDSNAIGTPIYTSGLYHTEVNTLLAGSMMITLSFLIVGLCLFLHRKLKSTTGSVSLHTLPWSDDNLEVYTLSGQEEVTGVYLPPTPSPPPAYETVVKIQEKKEEEIAKAREKIYTSQGEKKITREDDDLPSYETAIRLKGDDYI